MIVFQFSHYRKAFKLLFAAQRANRPGWSTALLAEKIRVQPSYLTNVIMERAHFSSDQIYALALELELTDDETLYLDLLMEWERSELATRKDQLLKKIQALRHKYSHADQQLRAIEVKFSETEREHYYLDPNIELIHLYLGTKEATTDIQTLALVWGLRPEYVADIVAFLQKLGLVEKGKKGWKVKPVHQLLSHKSPLCKPQQLLKRLRSIDVIQRLPKERIYSFNATLTMSEETRAQIQTQFLEFLKNCEAQVLESPAEGIYNLQFDLFPWV